MTKKAVPCKDCGIIVGCLEADSSCLRKCDSCPVEECDFYPHPGNLIPFEQRGRDNDERCLVCASDVDQQNRRPADRDFYSLAATG